MTKAGRAAREIARLWFQSQTDLSKKCVLQTRLYDPDVGGRLFTVRYFAHSLNQDINIYEFYVLDDGTVHIKTDNRHLASEGGRVNESRFFEIMKVRTECTPKWFLSVKRATRFFDAKGIDGFIFVKYKPGERRLRIPVQIKSSELGIKSYMAKHPHCIAHSIPILIINPKKDDDQLRRYVYGQISTVRSKKIKDGTRFNELYQVLMGKYG